MVVSADCRRRDLVCRRLASRRPRATDSPFHGVTERPRGSTAWALTPVRRASCVSCRHGARTTFGDRAPLYRQSVDAGLLSRRGIGGGGGGGERTQRPPRTKAPPPSPTQPSHDLRGPPSEPADR